MNGDSLFDRLKQSTMHGHPCLSIGTLTADILDQRGAVKTLEEQEIDLLHIDVMDGRVWPKITVGHFFIAGLSTKLLKDVHLLVEQPEKQIPLFVQAGADMIAFSVESCADIGKTIDVFNKAVEDAERTGEVRCGLSIYPGTPLSMIEPHIAEADYVTIVSIGPDTGKENFLHEMQDRVAKLRSWNKELLICIDGAVKKTNVGEVATMGANVIVTGSAVFDGNDAAKNITEMKQEIAKAIA